MWSPGDGLLAAVREGEAAVTAEAIARIHAWFGHGTPAADLAAAFERPPTCPGQAHL